MDFRFEAAADDLRGAGLFEGDKHGRAHLRKPLPLLRRVLGDSASKRDRLGEQRHMRAFGKYFQISSAVKTSIGAARRTSALLIFHTAVCAERRDLFLGAFVYKRSFSTSK